MTEDPSIKASRPLGRTREYDADQREANRLSVERDSDSGDRAAHVVTMVLLGATVVGAAVKLGLNWTTG